MPRRRSDFTTQVVNEARTPRLYGELGVPDTPEGRFEMVALHAALLIRRLRAEAAAGHALGQALFDLMFADMDASMRELGVGDLGVGKQVKRLAGQFYARLAALDGAFGGGDRALSSRCCGANVYHGGPAAERRAGRRAREHLRALERHSPRSRRSRCCAATASLAVRRQRRTDRRVAAK